MKIIYIVGLDMEPTNPPKSVYHWRNRWVKAIQMAQNNEEKLEDLKTNLKFDATRGQDLCIERVGR